MWALVHYSDLKFNEQDGFAITTQLSSFFYLSSIQKLYRFSSMSVINRCTVSVQLHFLQNKHVLTISLEYSIVILNIDRIPCALILQLLYKNEAQIIMFCLYRWRAVYRSLIGQSCRAYLLLNCFAKGYINSPKIEMIRKCSFESLILMKATNMHKQCYMSQL